MTISEAAKKKKKREFCHLSRLLDPLKASEDLHKWTRRKFFFIVQHVGLFDKWRWSLASGKEPFLSLQYVQVIWQWRSAICGRARSSPFYPICRIIWQWGFLLVKEFAPLSSFWDHLTEKVAINEPTKGSIIFPFYRPVMSASVLQACVHNSYLLPFPSTCVHSFLSDPAFWVYVVLLFLLKIL